jgi:MFS family permease
VTAGALPILAFGWAFVKTLPEMLCLQLLAGFVLAGVNLTTTNYIFDSVEGPRIASTMANFNALNNGCAFAGSVSGGLLATAFASFSIPFFSPGNCELVFLVSGTLRLAVLLLLGKGFSEVRSVEPSPSVAYFYVHEPISRVMSRAQALVGQRNGEGDGEGEEGR